MTVCLNNPVLGREITDNFTFDDANNQIVPKPGTDTKPGALALNLGNATGDTTNATDALTAAGFNAMANAVDSTAPLCGNEIQQAVAVAVGQSIACDAAAQEAIACAIASNPDAVACLKAVLPSGVDCSGNFTSVATTLNANILNYVSLKSVDGSVSVNAPVGGVSDSLAAGGNGSREIIRAGSRAFVIAREPVDGGVSSYSVNPTTGALTLVSSLSNTPFSGVIAVNKDGTKVLVGRYTNVLGAGNYQEYTLDGSGALVNGVTISAGTLPSSFSAQGRSGFYIDNGSIFRNSTSGLQKLEAGQWQDIVNLPYGATAFLAPNGQYILTRGMVNNVFVNELYSLNGLDATLIGPSSDIGPWAPDSSHAVSLNTGSIIDVSTGQAVVKPGKILSFSTNKERFFTPVRFGPTGKGFTVVDFGSGATTATAKVLIFKASGDTYTQCSETVVPYSIFADLLEL